jgi:hypothetical protein
VVVIIVFLSHILVSEGNLCTATLDLFLSLLFYYPFANMHVLVHSSLFSAVFAIKLLCDKRKVDVLQTLQKVHNPTSHWDLL